MFLLKFTLDGKDYFLHGGNGSQFIGAETEKDAHIVATLHTAKAVGVKGFTVVEMTRDELAHAVGFTQHEHPFYDITDVSGGLGIPFCAVRIVKDV